MAQSIPKTVKQWNVAGKDGFESLKFSEQPVPELGDSQVLVKSEFQSPTMLSKSMKGNVTNVDFCVAVQGASLNVCFQSSANKSTQ